jgi:hypothetical protein
MRQIVSVLDGDGKLRYFLADGEELTEFAIVNAGLIRSNNGHGAAMAAMAIANVGVAMTANFALGARGGGTGVERAPRALPAAEAPAPTPASRGSKPPSQNQRAWSRDKRLLAALQEHPGLRRAELRALLGCTEPQFSGSIGRLKSAGKVRVEGWAQAARWYPVE